MWDRWRDNELLYNFVFVALMYWQWLHPRLNGCDKCRRFWDYEMWAQTSLKQPVLCNPRTFFLLCCVRVCVWSVRKKAGTERAAFHTCLTNRRRWRTCMHFALRRRGQRYPWLATECSRHSVWPQYEILIITYHAKMKSQALIYIYIVNGMTLLMSHYPRLFHFMGIGLIDGCGQHLTH